MPFHTDTYKKGELAFENGAYEDAWIYWESLKEEYMDSIAFQHLRAKCAYKLGAFSEASEIYKIILKELPKADIYEELAIVYLHWEKMEPSLDAFSKALELDPENPYRYASRAFAKTHFKEVFSAVEDYEKALALDPKDPIINNNLGMLYEQMGYKEDANKLFSVADKDRVQKSNSSINETKTPKSVPSTSSTPKVDSNKSFIKMFAQTLKKLFSDPEEREAFMDFIKGKKSK